MSECIEKALLPSESIGGRWEVAHLLLIGFDGAAPASAGFVAVARGTVVVVVVPAVGHGVEYRLPLMLGRWMVLRPLWQR